MPYMFRCHVKTFEKEARMSLSKRAVAEFFELFGWFLADAEVRCWLRPIHN
jgi:hypothetical protein